MKVDDAVPSAIDGRRARRDRGRAAVIQAFFDLLDEGHTAPGTEAIVQRSGVSLASIFRYFESLDDLQHQVVDAHFDRSAHLFRVPGAGRGTLDVRIRTLVRARLDLHEATAPVARLARARSSEQPVVATGLHRVRAALSDQVEDHFAPELATHQPSKSADLVALIASLTSFEAWDLLVETGRTRRQIQRAWTLGLHALIGR